MKADDSRITVSRRQFIASASAAAVGMAGGGVRAMGGPMSNVALAGLKPDADDDLVEAAVRRAALAVTDFNWLEKGQAVIIKPVSNSGNPYPATTHPAAVYAIGKLLIEKGAGRVIMVDQSGVEYVRRHEDETEGSSRKLMFNNNLDQMARDAGVERHYPEEGPYEDYFLEPTRPGSGWKKGVWLPNILREADHVVLLPRVGAHILAGTTLGYKAAVGWLRDDSRLELHRDAATFFQKIAEIHSTKIFKGKLRFTLSVANRTLSTYGPDKGYVTEPDTGLVLASTDLLAHDMAAFGWYKWNYDNATPEKEKSRFRDKRYAISTSRVNKLLVHYAWNRKEGGKTEELPMFELSNAASDRTIGAAMSIEGGMPSINWKFNEDEVPPILVREINARIA